jgi:F0F1-type ATP synthase assembly protein I
MVQPPRKSPMAHAGIGLELAVPVVVFVFIGYKLDERWGSDPWLVVLGATLGMTLGFYSLFKRYMPGKSKSSDDEDPS